EIAHPALFIPKPGADALAANRAAEAEDVASKAATAKHAAVTASRDAAQARMAIRLYVRRAFEPILEIPVAIQEPERPIGTHVFTATERPNGETGMRWSVISLEGGRSHDDVVDRRAGASRGPEGEPTAKEPSDAKTALDRIVIPPEVLRIAAMAS